jgi:pimeloyl-ACP methyl ester carboxylesterase
MPVLYVAWTRSLARRQRVTNPYTDVNDGAVRRRRSWWPRIAITVTVGVIAAVTGVVAANTAGAQTQAANPAAVVPARFNSQSPAWHSCEFKWSPKVECATIKVPLDYQQPDGTSIDLAISRLRTSVAGKRRGILLHNPGGPGESGLDVGWTADELSQEVRDQFDIIGFDPRGVGASSPISCGLTEPELQLYLMSPYKPETFAAHVATDRAIADKCAARAASTMPYITTRNTARDMDVIRAVLGEEKVSYFGMSYGTYLGAVYTQLFPDRSDRIVLDSAIDPAVVWRGLFQAMGAATNPAFERWTEFTAKRDSHYGLGSTAAAVSKTFWDLVERAKIKPIQTPDQVWTSDDIRLDGSLFSVEQHAALISRLKKAADGVGVDPTPAARNSAAQDPPLARRADAGEPPSDNHEAVQLAIICNDVTNWPRDPEQYRQDAIRDRQIYPLAGDYFSNIMPCAFWSLPHTEQSSTVGNTVAALIIQNEWDPQTPLSGALGLQRALAGSRLVLVDEGEGHIAFYNGCARQAVNAYLSSGTLPATDVTCAVDPAPQDATSVRRSPATLPAFPAVSNGR